MKKFKFVITFIIFFLLPNTACSKRIHLLYDVKIPKKNLKLYYKIYWGPIPLGKSTITITPKKYTSVVYTIGIGNLVYPFYAKWETWIDSTGHPVKILIYSRHRSKKRKKLILFYPQKREVIIKYLLPNPSTKEVKNISFPLYDELSAFVAAFFINYFKTPCVRLPLYIRGTLSSVKIKVEKIVTYKNRRCFKIKVKLPKKSELLKRSSEVEVYLDINSRLPLVLKSGLPIFGSLTGKLIKLQDFSIRGH